MQLLSQATPLVAPDVLTAKTHLQEFLQRPEIHHLANLYVIEALLSQVLVILGYWIASKTLAPKDKATILNALLLWLSYSVFSVVMVIGLGLLLPIVAVIANQDQIRGLIILGGTTLTTILLIFLIPMKIYVIGFLRALLLLLLTWVITVAGMGITGLVLVKATGADKDIAALRSTLFKPGADPQKFFRRLAGQDAPDEIDRLLDDALDPIGPKPSLAEREAQVRELQQKLQARGRTFPRGTPLPPDYQDQLARYKQFLAEVTAEMAAAPRQPAS
jgi:hypothetical protein